MFDHPLYQPAKYLPQEPTIYPSLYKQPLIDPQPSRNPMIDHFQLFPQQASDPTLHYQPPLYRPQSQSSMIDPLQLFPPAFDPPQQPLIDHHLSQQLIIESLRSQQLQTISSSLSLQLQVIQLQMMNLSLLTKPPRKDEVPNRVQEPLVNPAVIIFCGYLIFLENN